MCLLEKESMLIEFSHNNKWDLGYYHFISKWSFRGNTGSNWNRRKSLKVYKSHTGKCFIVIPNHGYVMTWLYKSFPIKSKITHTNMDQHDFFGSGVFGGKFGSECFGLSLFCFCLVQGEKVASAQDFGWQSKGEDHFKSWFPFFPYLVVIIPYCLDICFVRRPFCIILSFSSDLLSGIFFFPLFSSDLWSENFFFFSLVFFRTLIKNFLFLFAFETCWPLNSEWLFFLGRSHCSFFQGQGLWWFEVLAQKAL